MENTVQGLHNFWQMNYNYFTLIYNCINLNKNATFIFANFTFIIYYFNKFILFSFNYFFKYLFFIFILKNPLVKTNRLFVFHITAKSYLNMWWINEIHSKKNKTKKHLKLLILFSDISWKTFLKLSKFWQMQLFYSNLPFKQKRFLNNLELCITINKYIHYWNFLKITNLYIFSMKLTNRSAKVQRVHLI